MNIIFCPMPLRAISIVKHDCGTAVAAFSSRTFGGPGILQSSRISFKRITFDLMAYCLQNEERFTCMKNSHFHTFESICEARRLNLA